MGFLLLKWVLFCFVLSSCEAQRRYSRRSRARTKSRSVTELVNDPKFKDQWYLGQLTPNYPGRHNNILAAWKQRATGRGVTVGILDNGVQLDHPDLQKNLDKKLSHNYLDPKKPPEPSNKFNKYRHGTQMAGIVGMTADNKVCGIGVAFNSKVSAIKILGPVMNVSQHAAAHSHLPEKISIYSESYGPFDNGKVASRYQHDTLVAIRKGVRFGRNKLGSIYVKSSGNGEPNGDHCGADGTVNTIFNIAVAAAARDHKKPKYSEQCAAIMTSAYTQHTASYFRGQKEKDIVTLGVNSKCIDTNGGSSTATAMTSGIIALALSVNRRLTWRDIMYLVIFASNRNKLPGEWKRNGVGREVSHQYGFGILNAGRMVNLAKRWRKVPKMGTCFTPYLEKFKRFNVTKAPERLTYKYQIRGCSMMNIVEQVSVITTTKFSKRGDIEIRLTSPSKTKSLLLGQRKNDKSSYPFKHWQFTSVHYWGECVVGDWELEISFLGKGTGYISKTYLVFYGIKDRRRNNACYRRRQNSRSTSRRYG